MLRVLIVILGGNPIIASCRFLRQREVTLVYLEGASSDTLARAMSIERLILLWSSRRLVGWPVGAKAPARPLIGARSHNALIGRFAPFAQEALFRVPPSSLEASISGHLLFCRFINWSSGAVAKVETRQRYLRCVSAIQILRLSFCGRIIRSVNIVPTPQQRGGVPRLTARLENVHPIFCHADPAS